MTSLLCEICCNFEACTTWQREAQGIGVIYFELEMIIITKEKSSTEFNYFICKQEALREREPPMHVVSGAGNALVRREAV